MHQTNCHPSSFIRSNGLIHGIIRGHQRFTKMKVVICMESSQLALVKSFNLPCSLPWHHTTVKLKLSLSVLNGGINGKNWGMCLILVMYNVLFYIITTLSVYHGTGNCRVSRIPSRLVCSQFHPLSCNSVGNVASDNKVISYDRSHILTP